MSRGTKIGCAIVAALFVLCALVCLGAGFGGKLWFEGLIEKYDTLRPIWLAEAKVLAADGPEACIKDGLRRGELCGPFAVTCNAESGVRTSMCLEASEPPPEFCADVPPRSDILDVSFWALDECERLGHESNDKCPELFTRTVATFCEKQRGH